MRSRGNLRKVWIVDHGNLLVLGSRRRVTQIIVSRIDQVTGIMPVGASSARGSQTAALLPRGLADPHAFTLHVRWIMGRARIQRIEDLSNLAVPCLTTGEKALLPPLFGYFKPVKRSHTQTQSSHKGLPQSLLSRTSRPLPIRSLTWHDL